jgi:hypothetical protein
MTFSFFIINAHIEIYFIIRIVFLDGVHYKTLNTMLDVGHQSSKPHTGA